MSQHIIAFHEYADLFPLSSDEELETLAADITQNGQRYPVLLYEGKILDGRNRYRACGLADIKPVMEEYTGPDPLGMVISLNLRRRHLSESQRAMIASNVANMRQGERTDLLQICRRSQSEAAEMLNVSLRSVASAAKVKEYGIPELGEAVTRDEISVSEAAKLAEMEPEFQKRVMKKVSSGEAKKVKDAVRRVKHEDRPNIPAPAGKYRVIYADPPWKYGNSGLDDYGHAERHYPTMSIKELSALPVKELTEDNAVLFLWATSPLLEECFEVIRAWGFEYKTSFVWDKVGHNMGHYNSVRHEFLLVCTRGSCTPDNLKLFDSVQTIEKSGRHSEKPEEFRQIIDTLYTYGNKIELFARQPAKGWVVWGNEPARESAA